MTHRSRDPEMHRSCPVWCQVNAQAGIANGLFGPVVSEEMPAPKAPVLDEMREALSVWGHGYVTAEELYRSLARPWNNNAPVMPLYADVPRPMPTICTLCGADASVAALLSRIEPGAPRSPSACRACGAEKGSPDVLPELPRPVAQLEDALSRVYYTPAPDTSGAGLFTKALRFLRRSDPRKSPGEHGL